MSVAIDASNIQADLVADFDFLFEPMRYKVAYGGRGAAKSFSFAEALVIIASQKKTRILCAREFQNSIAESVHEILKSIITDLRLDYFFAITNTCITGLNGSEFFFSGIKQNVRKIKSMEGIDICWVEEAETVTEASWDVLIPTIRKQNSEIWITFNPDAESDPTYQRFVLKPPPNAIIKKTNYTDNPFISSTLLQEALICRDQTPETYRHIWLGEPRLNAGGMVRTSWFQRFRTPPEQFQLISFSLDTASTESEFNDPSVIGVWGMTQRAYYLIDVWVGYQELPELKRTVMSYAGKYNPNEILIENKSSGIALRQVLAAETRLPLIAINPDESKVDRLNRCTPVIESGKVFIPESAPWVPAFLNEMSVFPSKKHHDDQVDMTSQYLNAKALHREPRVRTINLDN